MLRIIEWIYSLDKCFNYKSWRVVIVHLLPIGWWLDITDVGVIRVHRANTRAGDDTHGVVSEDVVGKNITNVGGNTNKTAKTFIGTRGESLGVRHV